MAQTITFDELAAGVQSSTALRTALDKLAASLSTVGSAGEGAQEVLQQLQSGLRATAAVTGLSLGLNLFNALTIGVLGVPGLGLLLLVKWVLI